MKSLQFKLESTIFLGIISMIGGAVTYLALTDIYHGEADVALEWTMVCIFAALFFLFIIFTLITCIQSLKKLVV